MKKINFKELTKGFTILLLYFVMIPFLLEDIFRILNLPLTNSIYYKLFYILTYLLTLLVFYLFYKKDLITEFKNYIHHFKSYFSTGITYYLLALGFLVISNLLISSIVGNIAVNEAQDRELVYTYPVFSFITMVFIGPFIEEVVCRKGFYKTFKNKQVFMIFTALLFGCLHLFAAIPNITDNYLQLLYIIPYSGMGYFFAKAYVETDNIYTSTTIHMLHNAITITLILILGLVRG